MDPYKTLGLTSGANAVEIKAAHRRLVKKFHPDTGGDRNVFEMIQLAYDVLMDPERRAHYDATGEIVEKGADNAHAAALALLAAALDAVLTQSVKQHTAPHYIDLAARMREGIEAGIKVSDKDRLKAAEARAKWRDLRDRFTAKDGQPNVMGQLLESRITNIDRAMRQLDDADAVAKAALDILADHEFRFDKRPQQAGVSVLSGIFATTISAV